jgi:hypothetical protein
MKELPPHMAAAAAKAEIERNLCRDWLHRVMGADSGEAAHPFRDDGARFRCPAGIDYSLTLHGPEGERLVGFDNAHPVGRQKRGEPQDHRHRLRSIRPYEYQDAATLLADFWETVDAVLRERGVIP